MTEKKRILLATADTGLGREIISLFEKRGQPADWAQTETEAAKKFQEQQGHWAAVAADEGLISEPNLQKLVSFCQNQSVPLVILESPQKNKIGRLPTYTAPLGTEFEKLVDGFQGSANLILADSTVFNVGSVLPALQQRQITYTVLENEMGIADVLKNPPAAPAPQEKSGAWFKRLTGSKSEENKPQAPPVGAAVVLWKGTRLEAETLAAQLQSAVPEARCCLVSGLSGLRASERALKSGKAALLRRDCAKWIPDLLEGKRIDDPAKKGQVLLLDNFKPELMNLTRSLWKDGYEISANLQVAQALEEAALQQFQVAVLGAAMAFAKTTGVDLSKKLRALYPEIRIIILVDRYPLQAALQGITQAVEFGLDDSILKPVDPSVLIFSINRAIEKFKLQGENARLLKELTESNDRLGQLNTFQSKFFAMVAHDIKNPLTAIKGYSEMLLRKLEDPKALQYCNTIVSSSKTLETLISDLVDLAAIQSGKLRINKQPMDFAQVMREVQSRVEIYAKQHDIQFSVKELPSIPPLVGDAQRLGQVLTNLCTNAVHYTPAKGSVTVSAEVTAKEISVSVQDTGIGISKEDLPKVFSRFFQTEKAQQMRKGGFGLGLTIAQEIVASHGGRMGVESELGKGSRFYFALPYGAGS